MKAGFSFTKRFVPKFHGNSELDAASQMVANLSMLCTADLFAILDRISATGVKDGDGTKLSLERAGSLVKEAGTYLPTYVTLENAEDFTMDQVLKYPAFFPLAAELLFALVEFAQPTEADAKN